MVKKGEIKSLISSYLSEISEEKRRDEKTEQKEDTIEFKERFTKRRKWVYRGFYISPENEIRLREIEMEFFRKGEKIDRSDIINLAIEKLYADIRKQG